MGKWKQQSMLMCNSTDLDDRVSRLIEWAADLSADKLRKCMQSAFRTLNNPNRYKYYWQEGTRTHEKYLTFLACLNDQCDRHGGPKEWYYELTSCIDMNRSKGWLTMYYIIMLYRKHNRELYQYNLRFSRSDAEDILSNTKNGGYEFKDVDYYSYKDYIDSLLDDDDSQPNKGSLVSEIEQRRSMVDDRPKAKTKSKVTKSKHKVPQLLTIW